MIRSLRGPILATDDEDVRVARYCGYRDYEIELCGQRLAPIPPEAPDEAPDDDEGAAPAPPPAEPDVESAARREWVHDAALRAEFGELETYLAYRRASAAGLVRELGGVVR